MLSVLIILMCSLLPRGLNAQENFDDFYYKTPCSAAMRNDPDLSAFDIISAYRFNENQSRFVGVQKTVGSTNYQRAYHFNSYSNLTLNTFEIFPQGVPYAFSFESTFRTWSTVQYDWNLFEFRNYNSELEMSFTIVPQYNTILVEYTGYNGRLHQVYFNEIEFSDFSWHKVMFGVTNDLLRLWIDCVPVKSRSGQYEVPFTGRAPIDGNDGTFTIARNCYDQKTVPIELQWMTFSCDVNKPYRTNCNEIPTLSPNIKPTTTNEPFNLEFLTTTPSTEFQTPDQPQHLSGTDSNVCPVQCPEGPPGPKGAKGEPGQINNGVPIMIKGEPGVPGEKGMAGFPGVDGARGPPGKPGLQINGQKGEPGEPGIPASAVQLLKDEKGMLVLPGPKGPPGLQGVAGPPGTKGEMGLRGPPGPDGRPGLPGIQGIPGKDGMPGVPGIKGEQGVRGMDGLQGLPGIPGNDGRAGIPGRDGDAGIKGMKGEGVDENQIRNICMEVVKDYMNEHNLQFRGPPGIPGMKGAKGEIGIGIRGRDGYPGSKGERGSEGHPGVRGYPGERGIPGMPGRDGAHGIKGEQGAPGIGMPGPPGVEGPHGPPGLSLEGAPGIPGYPGVPGERGDTGLPGLPGPPGVCPDCSSYQAAMSLPLLHQQQINSKGPSNNKGPIS